MCGCIPNTVEGFAAVVTGPDVVASRREMLAEPDAIHFISAEKNKVNNMIWKGVYEWCDLPRGERAISSKFTYKRKRCPTSIIEKYKARLVARGFEQQPGINYVDTSAPVAGVTGFWLVIVITLNMGWKTHS